MKKKISKIAGLTLIEILIAIVISSLMMLAMFTSYTIVNSTYRQVTDRAKISQAGRDLVGQVLREIRMAGFKYLNDDIAANDEHNPIKITSGTGLGGTCDKLEIVYGGVDYDKITYECKKSDQAEGDGFKILKSKQIWETGTGWTKSPGGKSDDTLYEQEDVLDYVQDFVFVAHDEDGKIITSSLPYTPDKSRAFDVRTVDVGLILRSTKEFSGKEFKFL